MFVPLVLAAALTTPPPPGPLSPENLPAPPPPPAAHPAEPVWPSYQVNIEQASWDVAGPADDVPARVVAAMAVAPGFRFAEVDRDGVIRGTTDGCRLIAAVAPGKPTCTVYLIAAGYGDDDKPVKKASEVVGDHLKKSRPGAKLPVRAGAADIGASTRLPDFVIALGVRPRPADRRHLRPLLELTLAQLGCDKSSVLVTPRGSGLLASGSIKDNGNIYILVDSHDASKDGHCVVYAQARKSTSLTDGTVHDAVAILLHALYD